MTELGTAVRKARKDAGMTQRELARRVGRSPSWVCQIETGKIVEPGMDTLTALASVLPDYTLADLQQILGYPVTPPNTDNPGPLQKQLLRAFNHLSKDRQGVLYDMALALLKRQQGEDDESHQD